MTKYVHIVQVHPVELGKPNFAKVVAEQEFDTEDQAYAFQTQHNDGKFYNRHGDRTFAFYHGRINDATGAFE